MLHIETNDITNANKSEEITAEEILKLELKLKSETQKVLVSNVILWRDKWRVRVQKVNKHLKEPCRKYNFFLRDNCKFIKVFYLHKSGIHLKDTMKACFR